MAKGDAEDLRADVDDGYTRLANLLVEAMACCPFTGTEYATILFVIRRTYGWANPKDRTSGIMDQITAAEIAEGTARPRRTVEGSITSLVKANVLLQAPVDVGNLKGYGLNSDVSQWGLPTAEWKYAKVQLREARDAGTYTRQRVDLYAESRIPIRENAYTYTQNHVEGEALSPRGSRLPEALQPNDVQPNDVQQEGFAVPAEPQPDKPAKQKTPKADTPPKPETPQQVAIREAWEAHGFESPPGKRDDKGKITSPGYSGLVKLCNSKGLPIVREWSAAVARNNVSVPDGAEPWAWFCTQFRDALNRPWEWRGDGRGKQGARALPLQDERQVGLLELPEPGRRK